MSKRVLPASTVLFPLPAVMVSCGSTVSDYNIITISWTGTICTIPPMCYISIRSNRHSHLLISQTMEFVINLTPSSMIYEMDWCGVKSGKDVKKFEAMKLTPIEAKLVKAPLIAESPLNIECKVKEIKQLGSHDMFIAEVIAVHADEKIIDSSGKINLGHSNLLSYCYGNYYEQGKNIGKFGFSAKS